MHDKALTSSRRQFIKGLGAGTASLLACNVLSCRQQERDKPNILFMMSDDLGWRDLSCFGNQRLQTPHIDRLAGEGLKLKRYYSASAVCTPTRVSLLTGKYPLRFDVRKHFADAGEYLPLCNSVPKLLKSAGYRTAHVGKWHLGGLRLQDCQDRNSVPGPLEHGFDHYLAQIEEQPLRGQLQRNEMLYRRGGTCLLRNDSVVTPDDPYYRMHLTDINGEETVRLIEQFHSGKEPFFINLWWLAPHTPYEPAPEPHWSQTAATSISEDQHRFRSMLARMDYQTGRILDTLDRLGIADNTLVFFVSDNGGAYESNIGNLKGGKTDLHEGGIRVPGLVRWPGYIRSQSVTSELCHSNDMLPTICAAAGVSLPDNDAFDGINLLPLFTGKRDRLKGRTLFWQMDLYSHLQRHSPKPQPFATEASRKGGWKLLTLYAKPVELYDIKNDPFEKNNLLPQKAKNAAALQSELQNWLAQPRQPFGRAD